MSAPDIVANQLVQLANAAAILLSHTGNGAGRDSGLANARALLNMELEETKRVLAQVGVPQYPNLPKQ